MHARRTTNHPVVRTYLSTERRFLDGFLGFSVRALKPLIDHARATQESKPQRINAPIPAAPTAWLSAVGTTTTASNQLPKTE
jgi:hypothetical protein